MKSNIGIPSREEILRILRSSHSPVLYSELKHQLKITDEICNGFSKRLAAMQRDGQLIFNFHEIKLLSNRHLISGKVEGHRDGFGFLLRDDGKPDLYLSFREMLKVMHGDKVIAKLGNKYHGKYSGKIVEILNRKQVNLVGQFFVKSNLGIFLPDDQRIRQDIIIPSNGVNGAKNGQVVIAHIVEYPTRYNKPIAHIHEILGYLKDPGIEIEISMRKFEISSNFPEEVIHQAEALPDSILEEDFSDRIDLRNTPFITIDNEDSLDFDDAIYCESVQKKDFENQEKLRLLVAISDVSHYVKPNSFLDNEALKRATSIYFPRKVIPMLPEKLSNKLCSLLPSADRLVLVCDMTVLLHGRQAGTVVSYRFYNAIINSFARTTYSEVYKFLSSRKSVRRDETENKLGSLIGKLYELYIAFLKARKRRGTIDFDITETKLILNKFGKIKRIIFESRNDAQRLVEECMLAANTCAADFVSKVGHPNLYRVHDQPTQERLSNLQGFLKSLNLSMNYREKPRAKDYNDFLDSVHHRSDFNIIQSMCLRSMQQAFYSPKNIGHFGLAYTNYSHFTSPIRRYPDLLMHRIIKSILQGKNYDLYLNELDIQNYFSEWKKEKSSWENLACLLSLQERRSDEVSRDVESQLKCSFAKKWVGEIFNGSITSITNFGIFVMMDSLKIEGLIHISKLGHDNFQFNEITKKLRNHRSGICYSLADRVQVQINEVDSYTKKIELSLIKHWEA